MKHIYWFPDDERPDLRVYCALAMASFYLAHLRSNGGNFKVTIEDAGADTKKYLWTAYMMLGPTATTYENFTSESITVDKQCFDPYDELGWFRTFASSSTQRTVFLPVLANHTVTCPRNEYQLEFGHHVPDEKISLKQEVQTVICNYVLRSLFEFKNNKLIIDPENLFEIDRLGDVKLTQVLAMISNDYDVLDFNDMPVTYKNFRLVKALLNCLPPRIKTINLDRTLISPAKLPSHLDVGPVIESVNTVAATGHTNNKGDNENRGRSVHLHFLAGKSETTLLEIKNSISMGVDINYQDPASGDTALIAALKIRNETVAEFLLKNNTDPLIKNVDGKIARDFIASTSRVYSDLLGYELLFATNNNDIATVMNLVNSNPKIIDFQGAGGYTALLIAAEQSFLDIAMFLIQHEANPDITCYDGASVAQLITDPKILGLLPALPGTDKGNHDNPYEFFKRDLLGQKNRKLNYQPDHFNVNPALDKKAN